MFKQRRRWASGGIYVLLTKTGSLLKHPIKNLATMPIIIDYAFSIVWSFFYWISMFLFLALEAYFLFTGNWERFVHGWYMTAMFVTIEVAVGVVQGILASYMNDGGKTLKYLLFLPWYLLVYWMVNTAAMVTEFIPTFLKVFTGDQCARLLRRPIPIHAHYRCNTKFAELVARCLVPCNRTESNDAQRVVHLSNGA